VRNVYLDCCQVQDRVRRRVHRVGGGLAATSRYRAACVSAPTGASVRDRRAGRRTCEEQRPISGYWFLPGEKRGNKKNPRECSRLELLESEKSRVSRTRSGAKPSSVKRQVDRLTRAIRQRDRVCALPEALLAIVRDRSQRAMEGWLAVRNLTTRKFHVRARARSPVFREECNSRSRFFSPSPRAVNSTVFR